MKLFGKKRKIGDKKSKKLYRTPSDVKLFYQMPILLVISVIIIIGSIGCIEHNARLYRMQVMASSMKYGEQLPLWGGQSKGNLTLGRTCLSKDGKTLAVEIRYDDNAHEGLSSFGNRYKLRLVDTTSNRMQDLKMTYGIFGTDGSGVLTLHRDAGFKNAAFIVMLIDNGQLVSSEDLQDQSQMTDDDIDHSITAQLSDSNRNEDEDAQNQEKRRRLPPIYYVRLNAHNAKRSNRNWTNDTEIIEDLFIKANLSKIREDMNKQQAKIKKAQATLNEMNERLKENDHDEVAKDGKNTLETNLADLNRSYKAKEKRYNKLKNSTFTSRILDPKQYKYHTYTISDLNAMH